MTDLPFPPPLPNSQVLFETSPDSYLVLAPDLTVVAATDAYLDAMGWRRAETVGYAIVEVFSRQPGLITRLPQLRAVLDQVLTQRSSHVMELHGYADAGGVDREGWRLIHSPVLGGDGELVQVIQRLEMVSWSHRGEDQAALQVEAAVQDRRQHDQEKAALIHHLRAADALLDTLLDNAPIGIGVWDEQLRFVRLNAALAEINGLSQAEHIGKTVEELLPGIDASVMAAFRHVLQTGESIFNQEASGQTPAAPGRQRYWSVSYYPIKLPGSKTWVGAICEEITDRRQIADDLREREASFRLLAENSTDVISRHAPSGNILYVSPACYAVLGYKPRELVGRSSHEFVHPDDLSEITGNHPADAPLPDIHTITLRVRHKQGHYIWLEATVRTIQDPQTGALLELQASSRDITERKRVENMQRFLVQASNLLAASLDYEVTLSNLARLIVPDLADWCVVDIIDDHSHDGMGENTVDDRSSHRIAVAHADPARQDLVEQLRHYPLNLTHSAGIAEMLQTGRSRLSPQITAAQIQASARSPEHLQLLQALTPRSGMHVPLVARGQVLGVISFVIASGDRCYSISDLLLAEELAHRAAIAVDNARFYQEARQSQQVAERAAVRTSRLQGMTAALSESLLPVQVAEVIVEQSLAAVGANSALVALLTADGTELEIVRTMGFDPALIESWRSMPIDAPLPLAEAVRSKTPVWDELTAVRAAHYPHLQQLYAQSPYQCWLSIPFLVEGRSVGGMSLAFLELPHLNQEDRSFIQALAQQCAQALERARLYAAEQAARETAEAANRIKDEFLAVLSHELRSPLNPILGWVRLLRTRDFDRATTERALETIERNAKLQAQLVEDLLDVSRILQGKLSLNISRVDLVAITTAALETIRLAAAARSIDLQVTLPVPEQASHHTGSTPQSLASDPNPLPQPAIAASQDSSLQAPIQVMGDATRLQQVVWNLLSNAVKFTPAGGRVEVRLERQRVEGRGQEAEGRGQRADMRERGQEEGSGDGIALEGNSGANLLPSAFSLLPSPYAQLTIRDTGKGISSDFLPYVFDYFRQEDGKTTRKFGGLGLGLAIVRQIVEMHGGTVQVESPGERQGATFTVRLPLLPDESGI